MQLLTLLVYIIMLMMAAHLLSAYTHPKRKERERERERERRRRIKCSRLLINVSRVCVIVVYVCLLHSLDGRRERGTSSVREHLQQKWRVKKRRRRQEEEEEEEEERKM